jgi:hypothetical protein
VTTALQRTVLVLGPRATEPTQLHANDIDGSTRLLVIAVGWPLTPTQQQAVESARSLAREYGIVFDAVLVGSFGEGLEAVSARDRVLLGTDKRETRRCNQLLHARKLSARVAR